MASVTVICTSCGSDISDAKGNRLLSTDASKHVKLLWCKIFDDELEQRGMQAQASSFVATTARRMCRRCFTCFERCAKLINSLKNGVGKAIEVFQQDNIYLFVNQSPQRTIGVPISIPPRSSLHPPPSKRVAVDSQSPDVVVRIVYLLNTYLAISYVYVLTVMNKIMVHAALIWYKSHWCIYLDSCLL